MTARPEPTRCEVWWARPGDDPARRSLLDHSERRRAARLRRAEDRERFVTGRALLRLLLAGRTGIPAAALRFDTTCRRCGAAHGKPRLARPVVPVAFNLAHAGDRVVVAVTDGPEVGVDVETVLDVDDPALPELAAEVLGGSDLSAYQALPAAERGVAMAQWWTRKEAVLKAGGEGLATPPSAVAVVARGAGAAVPASGPVPEPVLSDLHPGGGYVGCVAVLGASSLVVREHDGQYLLRTAR